MIFFVIIYFLFGLGVAASITHYNRVTNNENDWLMVKNFLIRLIIWPTFFTYGIMQAAMSVMMDLEKSEPSLRKSSKE